MLSTENLNLLVLRLSNEPETIGEFKSILESIFNHARYQEWLKTDTLERFTLPDDLKEKVGTFNLNDGSSLNVKINCMGSKIFITDGAWVQSLMRVFPDPDEAQLLVDYARDTKLDQWAEWLIDPAAGCGHTPIGLGGSAKRISCDINVRAILYATINAGLNGMGPDQFTPLLNNMRNGFPAPFKISGNTLVLSNVPFAPAPRDGSLAINSAGGTTGADLQAASFHLVKTFRNDYEVPVKACFVTWTVGSIAKDEWEVPEICRQVFAPAKVKWTLVQHDYDAPELPNPSPLEAMLNHLATSQYTVEETRQNLKSEYETLGKELSQQGFTHIAYGILEVDLS